MKRLWVSLTSTRAVILLVAALFALTGASATASNGKANDFTARLNGFQEVPPKLTNGTGSLGLHLSSDGTQISYTLSYSGMPTDAHFAHLHFAQRGVNGAVFVFLCGGGGKPACPPTGGTVSGTITAADILAVPDQAITAGDFAGALRILRSGDAYANVHTTQFPGGEIRGQVRAGGVENTDNNGEQ